MNQTTTLCLNGAQITVRAELHANTTFEQVEVTDWELLDLWEPEDAAPLSCAILADQPALAEWEHAHYPEVLNVLNKVECSLVDSITYAELWQADKDEARDRYEGDEADAAIERAAMQEAVR